MKRKNHFKGAVLLAVLAVATLPGCATKQTAVKDAPPLAANEPVQDPQAVVPPTGQVAADPATTGSTAAAPGEAIGTGASAQPAATEVQSGLQTVYFNFDSADLSTEAREALSSNFEVLNKKQTKLRIEGHCDERGSEDYNLALGEKRARAAYNYLVSLGIPEGRLATISYGEEKPAVSGNDEAAWSRNRRAAFVLE